MKFLEVPLWENPQVNIYFTIAHFLLGKESCLATFDDLYIHQ